MNNLYILIGFPGSFKSTWAKEKAIKEPNTIIVNRDSIRSMIKGGKYVFDKKYEGLIKKEVFGIAYQATIEGFDVIMDETHLTKEKRSEIIYYVKSCNTNPVNVVGVWFTENKKNLEYRMKYPRGYTREKWASVIEEMKKTFEEPDMSEFDELVIVK